MTICYRLTNVIEHNISDRHGGYKSTGQVITSGSESKGETNIKQKLTWLVQIVAKLTVLEHLLYSQHNFEHFNSINPIKERVWSTMFKERLMETKMIQNTWKVNGARNSTNLLQNNDL